MATGREIFKLFGTVALQGADSAETDLTNLDKTAQNTDKNTSNLGTTMAKVGKGVVAFGTAAVGAGVALLGIAKKGASVTDTIDKMSQKIGISRQAYQEWDFILSQNGASVDGLQMGMKTLTSAIFEAEQGTGTYVDALAGIGLQYSDLEGMSPEQQFETVFFALQNVEDETTRAALANDLLGRSASELAPALNAGTEAIEEQRQQAHDLGLVLGDEAIDAGVSFTDLMDQLTRTLQGGLMRIISDMLPIFNQLIQMLIESAPQIMSMIQPIFDALMPILPVLIDSFLQIVNALLPLLPLIAELISELLPPLMELIVPIIELLLQILTEIIPPLIPIIQTLAVVLTTILGAAFETLTPMIEFAISAFTGLLDFIDNVFTGGWEDAWTNIVDWFNGIWEGIVDFVKAPINDVIDLINKLFSSIGSIDLPDFLGGGSISLPQIPKLAKGTDYFQGGMMIAGDDPRTGGNGELITAPRGSKVYTSDETRDMLNGTTINVYGDTSPSGIARRQRQDARARALGVV